MHKKIQFLYGNFIAWDSEAVTDEHGHNLVLVMNSLGDKLVGPKLTSQEVIPWLYNTCKKYPDAIHVIYGGSYDANMWLRDALKYCQAKRLSDLNHTRFSVLGDKYSVRYLPRKYFNLKKVDDKKGITIWDIQPFFGGSFIDAIRVHLGLENDTITKGKSNRSIFKYNDIHEIIYYCHQELRLLVKLAEKIRKYHIDADIKLKRWDGPGASATALLKKYGIDKIIKESRVTTPELITAAAQHAYFGGRIEQVRAGTVRDKQITKLDINSAYPYAMTKLPDISRGTWEPVTYIDLQGLRKYNIFNNIYIAKVKYISPLRIHTGINPLPWRSSSGRVAYPTQTDGWYWSYEVELLPEDTQIDLAYIFYPDNQDRPFDFINDIYAKRLKMESKAKGSGYGIKTAMNASYGKLAQQVGEKEPPFHSLIYAGLVTSYVRAMIYRKIEEIRNISPRMTLIAIETDCITYADSDYQGVFSPDKKLGGWDSNTYTTGHWLASGIYWLFRQDGTLNTPKVRGIGPGLLNLNDVLYHWTEGNYHPIEIERSTFRGVKTSTITRERFREWCKWVIEPRSISLLPQGKRVSMLSQFEYLTVDLSEQLISTIATGGEPIQSKKYPDRWLDAPSLSTVILTAEQEDEYNYEND